MFKRALSFLIIIACISAFAYTMLAGSLFSALFGSQGGGASYGYCVDKRGNVFFIQNGVDGQKNLIGLDSSGRRFCKKDISAVTGKSCVVDNLYITQDNTVLITVYSLVSGSQYLNRVSVDLFREDGSFVTGIFKKDISERYDGRYRVISAMSDDDKNISFGFLSGRTITTYLFGKSSHQPSRSALNLELGKNDKESELNAFLTLPTGDVILSFEGGRIAKTTSSGEETSYSFGASSNVIVDNFWYSDTQFYCRDESSGDLYTSSPGELDLSCVMQGSKAVSGSGNLTFSRLENIAVGTSGNLMGITDSAHGGRIFAGGLDFLPEISTVGASGGAMVTSWLLLIGVIAGVIIVSLLVWDFFCNIMVMQMSLLLRQSLLVFFVIYISMYALTGLLVPSLTTAKLTAAYQSQSQKTAQDISDLVSVALKPSGNPQSAAAGFFNSYADAVSRSAQTRSLHVFLFKNNGSAYLLAASGEGCEAGLPAGSLEYSREIADELDSAENQTQTVTEYSRDGKVFCTFLPLKLTAADSSYLLMVVSPTGDLDSSISGMDKTVSFTLWLVGLALLLMVVFVEAMTALNLRRLRRGVDRIASGNYDANVLINSGDEVEALSKSIKTLSKNILKATHSLREMNGFYYRFVPQKFLETIGETRIEKVTKSSLASKENALMLFLRFRFSESQGENSRQIFSNINAVFEHIVPVINQNGGTVYNFLPDGFNAVFENEAEQVLRAAFHIREVIDGLNRERTGMKSQGGSVDVRVYITIGNIMLGFVGDETRMEPTAISGAAQYADPIIGISFESSIYVACTRDFLNRLPREDLRCRRIGKVSVLKETVELFDLYDSDPYGIVKIKELYADRFELGVKLFEKGDYKNALNMFMEIVKYSTLDGAARNYMAISEYNLHSHTLKLGYTKTDEFKKLQNIAEKR